MPTTTDESNVVLHRTRYTPSLGTCPRIETYGSRTKSQSQVTSPAEADTIKRTTPINKAMDPTSRGPYTSVHRSAATLSKEGSYTDYGWCSGPRKSIRPVYWSNLVLPTYSPAHASITTGWEVPMRNKIKGNAVNLGTSMAEYRQTCGMFSRAARGTLDVARKLAQARKDLRSGRLPRSKYLTLFHKPSNVLLAKHAATRLANARLLASYGIRPLLSDLSDSIIELGDSLNDLTITKSYFVRKSRTENWEPNVGVYSGQNTRGSHEVTDSAKVYATFKPSQYGHFTMGNMLEIGWEIIPFSFVVDSLINVGGVLGSLDYMNGVESLVGTVSRRVSTSYKVADDAFGYSIVTAGKGTEKYYHRNIIGDIPLPSNPFQYKPSTSANTVINLVSLLIGMRSWR